MKNFNDLKTKIENILKDPDAAGNGTSSALDSVIAKEVENILFEQSGIEAVWQFHYDPRALGCYEEDACFEPLILFMRSLNTEMRNTAKKIDGAMKAVENLLYVLFAKGIDEWYENRYKPYGFASTEQIALEEAVKAGLLKKVRDSHKAKESLAISKIVNFNFEAITDLQRTSGAAVPPKAGNQLRVTIDKQLQDRIRVYKEELYKKMLFFDGWHDNRIKAAYQGGSGNGPNLGLKRNEEGTYPLARPNRPWHETWPAHSWSPRSLKKKIRSGKISRWPRLPGRPRGGSAAESPAIRTYFFRHILLDLKRFMKEKYGLLDSDFIDDEKMMKLVKFLLDKHQLYDRCDSKSGYCGYEPENPSVANPYGAGDNGRIVKVNADRLEDLGLDQNIFWSFDLLYILKRFWRAAIDGWERVPKDGGGFSTRADAKQIDSSGRISEYLPPNNYVPHIIEALNDPGRGFFDTKEIYLIIHMKGTVDKMNGLTKGLYQQITQNVFFVGGFFITFGSVVKTVVVVLGCIALSYAANKYDIINLNPLDPDFLSTKSKFQELIDEAKEIVEMTAAMGNAHPVRPKDVDAPSDIPYIDISDIKQKIAQLDLEMQRWTNNLGQMLGGALLSSEASNNDKMKLLKSKFRINVNNVPGFEKSKGLPDLITWDQLQLLVRVVDGMHRDLLTMQSYFTVLFENMAIAPGKVMDFKNFKLKTDGYFGLSPARLEPATKSKPKEPTMHKIKNPPKKENFSKIYNKIILSEQDNSYFTNLVSLISESGLQYPTGGHRSSAAAGDPTARKKKKKKSGTFRPNRHTRQCLTPAAKATFEAKIMEWEKIVGAGFIYIIHGHAHRRGFFENFSNAGTKSTTASSKKLFEFEGLEHLKPNKDGWSGFMNQAKTEFERAKSKQSFERTGQPGGKNPATSIRSKRFRTKDKKGKRTAASYVHPTRTPDGGAGYVRECGQWTFTIGGNIQDNFVFKFGIGGPRVPLASTHRGKRMTFSGKRGKVYAMKVNHTRTSAAAGAPGGKVVVDVGTDAGGVELCNPMTLGEYAQKTKTMKKNSMAQFLDIKYQMIAIMHSSTNQKLVQKGFNDIKSDSCYSIFTDRADRLIRGVEIFNDACEAQLVAMEKIQEKWVALYDRIHDSNGRPLALLTNNVADDTTERNARYEAIYEYWASVLHLNSVMDWMNDNYYDNLYPNR